ncbi:hypothetical protein V498_07368 [Pseudogymnoascus sp. VKM F-4517 (FW-2822)]|nr:hypothetical protein V498_07368 [Pseudogymnoascus sp. VKM F-4517 (FW-2822)]
MQLFFTRTKPHPSRHNRTHHDTTASLTAASITTTSVTTAAITTQPPTTTRCASYAQPPTAATTAPSPTATPAPTSLPTTSANAGGPSSNARTSDSSFNINTTHRGKSNPGVFGSSSAIPTINLLATMSLLYQAAVFTDRSASPPRGYGAIIYPNRPTVFILLPGGWSGDMWHCAAATALCQSEDKKVIGAYPVTIIGMKEKVSWIPGGSNTVMVSRDQSILQGSRTYDYFHSIQIPCLLARINKFETKFRAAFGQNLIGGSGKYLDEIVVLHRQHYGNPGAVSRMMWPLTPETEEGANVGTFQFPPNVARPMSLPTENLFPSENEIPELAKSDVSPPYEFNGNEDVLTGPSIMLHLWTSTAITMQYLYKPDKRAGRIQYLQEQLGNISNTESTWVQQARKLSDKLVMLAAQEGVDRSNEKKIILFNYRKGDVNKQHDGNIGLLDFVSRFANAKGFVVVALLVNVSLEEVDVLRINNHVVLELYSRTQVYDKRYTAAFWSIVANELQGVYVQGLIGGRSGSMDIASFMGVNCCSFDEPIFGKKYKFDDEYILAQGGQLLRLISQYPVTSIVYVNTDSWFDSGFRYNSYDELDEKGLGEWLNRAPNDPHICPPISVVEVRGDQPERAAWGPIDAMAPTVTISITDEMGQYINITNPQ